MNNYERKWFARWFPTMDRLIKFKQAFQHYLGYSDDTSSNYYISGRLFRYNYPPNSVATKDHSFIWITRKKIEQAIKERELNIE